MIALLGSFFILKLPSASHFAVVLRQLSSHSQLQFLASFYLVACPLPFYLLPQNLHLYSGSCGVVIAIVGAQIGLQKFHLVQIFPLFLFNLVCVDFRGQAEIIAIPHIQKSFGGLFIKLFPIADVGEEGFLFNCNVI